MSRNVIAQFMLAAAISFTGCGGGSKSSDSQTTPAAQNEQQAPVPGEAVPSQGTASGQPTGTEMTPSAPASPSATGEPSSPGALPSSERQPVSGTTTDPTAQPGTGAATPGATTPSDTSGAATGTGKTDTSMSGSSGSGDAAATTAAAFSEPNIFAALSAANEHEIAVAQLAVQKSKNKDVKKFAKMMITDHTKMQASGESVAKKLGITPEDNADVKSLKDDSQTAQEKLRGLEGAEFDRAYMAQAVADHEKVLTLIDNQIMPAATSNDQIQALVKGARPKVEAHLAQARKISEKLGGSALGSDMK